MFIWLLTQKGIGIQNGCYSGFEGHMFFVNNTGKPILHSIGFNSRIKLTGFCQCRRVYAGTVYILCLFGCKPKNGVGIQNGRYSRFAGH